MADAPPCVTPPDTPLPVDQKWEVEQLKHVESLVLLLNECVITLKKRLDELEAQVELLRQFPAEQAH